MPALTLIVNTYDRPDYLRRVLRAISGQTSLPDEVLLADDGSGEETGVVFHDWASGQQCKTMRVWQPHEGFRRARILNHAIARATGDYLVFLDGDTVPHPQFLADHRAHAARGTFVQGHRALIKQQASGWFGLGEFSTDRRRALCQAQLQGLKHAFRWPLPWLRARVDLRGIRGCNLAVWRDDLLLVNGYNEAFIGWGREDSELAIRLMNAGRSRIDIRGRALCFHLWHPPASRQSLATNEDLLTRAKARKSTRCPLGVGQYLADGHPADSASTAPG